MMRAPVLEDFGSLTSRDSLPIAEPAEVTPPPSEEHRVQAFEEGYKAGWDDAAKAQNEDREKISADLAGNLQELSFTYAEVRSQMLASVEPLLKELVASVLPRLAADNIGALILQEVNTALAGQIDVPVEIVIAPGNRQALDAVVPQSPGFLLQIREEPTLGQGQAFMRIGKTEKQLDLNEILERATAAVAGFFEITEKAKVNE